MNNISETKIYIKNIENGVTKEINVDKSMKVHELKKNRRNNWI